MISTAFSILGKLGAIAWYGALYTAVSSTGGWNDNTRDQAMLRMFDSKMSKLGRQISAEFDSIVKLDCLTQSKDIDLTEGLPPGWSPKGHVMHHTPPGG